MIRVQLDGIGLLGPGLPGWAASAPVLAGRAPYVAGEMPKPVTDLLPPAERRRCGESARLALVIGMEALATGGIAPADVPTVFTSSSGNGEVVHQICESLATPEREVSPTRFHNSVHNAPAGYWSIAIGARTPSTSLCAREASFAAGLLEAALQCMAESRAVLLVACDLPHPFPLSAVAPVAAPFGVALLLAPARPGATAAMLAIEVRAACEDTRMTEPRLEALRTGNSAARALPLLAAVAQAAPATVAVGYVDGLALVVGIGR